MMRALRRLFWLGVLAAGAYGGYRLVQRRRMEPLPPQHFAPVSDRRPPVNAATVHSEAPAATKRWVEPVDGLCPDGFPVKANASSRIFHVPGGRFYARTVPERCYANPDDAAADGYRPAKA